MKTRKKGTNSRRFKPKLYSNKPSPPAPRQRARIASSTGCSGKAGRNRPTHCDLWADTRLLVEALSRLSEGQIRSLVCRLERPKALVSIASPTNNIACPIAGASRIPRR